MTWLRCRVLLQHRWLLVRQCRVVGFVCARCGRRWRPDKPRTMR